MVLLFLTILKKSRQDVTGVVCQLKAERADTIPAVFTKIHLHFVVTGRDVKEKQVAKAVELSACYIRRWDGTRHLTERALAGGEHGIENSPFI